MPEKKEYNGYTNYETWLCGLWLNNDQGQQEMMSEKAEEIADDLREAAKSPDSDDETLRPITVERYNEAVDEMATYIEQLVDDWRELYSLPDASFFTDLVNAGLREVDYRDLARNELEDACRDIPREVEKRRVG